VPGDHRPAERQELGRRRSLSPCGRLELHLCEASWTQALGDSIGAHTGAFEAIGGVPNLLVPDNTKVAVIKACLYEPQVLNRTYGRDGGALRHGGPPGPTAPAARQGQGRSRGC